MIAVRGDRWVDVTRASGGRFGPDPVRVLENWEEFTSWETASMWWEGETHDLASVTLGPPVPTPRQVFGIGLNYRLHAQEAGMDIPETPLVFTKFPSSVCGAFDEVPVPTRMTDWEVEVAVVIGPAARRVHRRDAWDYIAGITGAQDISARDVQFTPAGSPQFSMGKSFPNFLPLGPLMVTPDELPDRSAIELWCEIDGSRVQSGATDDLIFSIPELIEYLSSIVTLLPGDVILTGTPSGVGVAMDPPRFLTGGMTVRSSVTGAGQMRLTMVDDDSYWSWKK